MPLRLSQLENATGYNIVESLFRTVTDLVARDNGSISAI